jgi:hypothetical protein
VPPVTGVRADPPVAAPDVPVSIPAIERIAKATSLRWPARYLAEGEPKLHYVAEVVANVDTASRRWHLRLDWVQLHSPTEEESWQETRMRL